MTTLLFFLKGHLRYMSEKFKHVQTSSSQGWNFFPLFSDIFFEIFFGPLFTGSGFGVSDRDPNIDYVGAPDEHD